MKQYTVKMKELYPFLQSDAEPTLTCYVNDNAWAFAPDRKNSAVLIMPGGAYAMVCYEREGESIALNYLRAGFSAFVLTYSCAPNRYPEQILEAMAAMHYIRTHAEEYKVGKVAVSGFSAGGHLAASLGVWWNDPKLLEICGMDASVLRPDALILGYPVIASKKSLESVAHHGSIINLTGTADHDDPHYQAMSLEEYVREDTPPTYLWHTATDQAVHVENSLVFAEALAKNKVMFELHVYPYGPHGLATADRATNMALEDITYYCSTWIDESLKFLKRVWES